MRVPKRLWVKLGFASPPSPQPSPRRGEGACTRPMTIGSAPMTRMEEISERLGTMFAT